MTPSLIVRAAVVITIVAMMLVIVGMAWGGSYIAGAVLMVVGLAMFGVSGVVAALSRRSSPQP